MLQKVFSIFDDKAAAYLQPFFLDTTGQAIRAIQDCVSDPNHNFAKHTADYTLFQIGEFDNTTGVFQPFEKTSLGNFLELTQTKD